MNIAYVYAKVRTDFGKQVVLDDGPSTLLCGIRPAGQGNPRNAEAQENVVANPVVTSLDCSPAMSQTEVNTLRLEMATTPVLHREGGWPEEVDSKDKQDVTRFRRKVEKDHEFRVAVASVMGPSIARCMRQNFTTDIYEKYFEDDGRDLGGEAPAVKGLAVFKDPSAINKAQARPRPVCSVDWHPSGPTQIACSYSLRRFQDARLDDPNLPKQSYVWDLLNPNTPLRELRPPSPLGCLKFNPKTPTSLLGGCYNGLIAHMDTREPGFHCEASLVEHSHHDPV